MTFSFDVETVPLDGTDPVLDDDGHDLRALSPFTGRIVVIAGWDDEKKRGVCMTHDERMTATPTIPDFTLYTFATEHDLLASWWSLCAKQRRFATFNGNGFDVPFLLGRSVVNGVGVHRPLYTAKPWDDVHVDVCDRLKVGYKGRPSLDLVCRALGVPSPKNGGIDGSLVGEAWAGNLRAEVATYCCRDVTALANVLAAYDGAMGARVAW